jgi:hypothetical protein
VIASWNCATIAPRLLTGTISAMYSGTTVDAKPMPRPMTSRATVSTPRVGAAAARIAPTTNTTADSAMIRRRGRRGRQPARRERTDQRAQRDGADHDPDAGCHPGDRGGDPDVHLVRVALIVLGGHEGHPYPP